MLSGSELRDRRVLARISGRVVCERAGIARGRLSDIERGYVQPPEAELERIEHALEDLIRAKHQMVDAARECGWPVTAL